jgi:DNA helicase HerA-like ATPase
MKLRIATNFTLPPEAVTEIFAILGIRGSGKTAAAVVMTEELLAAHHQVVIIDPVDVWWGLQSSKDGKDAATPSPPSAVITPICPWTAPPAAYWPISSPTPALA